MQSLAEKQRIKCYNETGSIQDLVVHNCVCNEGKTNDGVENGGRRLVEELITVLKKESKARNSKIVTVSFVGNSLGGLYSRYAIVELSQSDALDFKVHFNIFCTTATPHLGISRHTYLPLPRSAENMVAHALGDTGKDLYVWLKLIVPTRYLILIYCSFSLALWLTFSIIYTTDSA